MCFFFSIFFFFLLKRDITTMLSHSLSLSNSLSVDGQWKKKTKEKMGGERVLMYSFQPIIRFHHSINFVFRFVRFSLSLLVFCSIRLRHSRKWPPWDYEQQAFSSNCQLQLSHILSSLVDHIDWINLKHFVFGSQRYAWN